MLTRVTDPRAFGVAELDDGGKVVGLEEKPQQPKSDLALVGVYMFTPAIHEAVRQLKPSWRNELEITEAIAWLIAQGKSVHSTTITGYWKDTGSVADMLEVNRLVLETVEPRLDGITDAGVRDHRPGRGRGGRAGVRIPHRRAGHHRRGHQGHQLLRRPVHRDRRGLRDRRHRDPVLDRARSASIRGVRRIEASLIGHHAEVTPAPRVPKVHRLVLGDHSRVQISS